MAKITVETSAEEQEKVMVALKSLEDQVVPVSTVAQHAGLGPSRTRYVIMDLIDQGRIERVPCKAFNKHYVRYKYKILKN